LDPAAAIPHSVVKEGLAAGSKMATRAEPAPSIFDDGAETESTSSNSD
jgi:hypothetical protein